MLLSYLTRISIVSCTIEKVMAGEYTRHSLVQFLEDRSVLNNSENKYELPLAEFLGRRPE